MRVTFTRPPSPFVSEATLLRLQTGQTMRFLMQCKPRKPDLRMDKKVKFCIDQKMRVLDPSQMLYLYVPCVDRNFKLRI